MRKILIVEDDRELKEGICYALQKAGYLTESADSVQNAKTLFLKEGADVILLDVNLPDGEGFDFLQMGEGTHTGSGAFSDGKRFRRGCAVRL